MEHLTTGIMEFSSYLLLLLVALSVSAVQEGLKEPHEVLSPDAEDKKRHSLYHNYSSHSNNRIVKATVQFDGVEVYCFIQKTTDTWTSSPWGIRMMDVDYTFRNYSKKLYHHLKGVLSKETDSDLTQRFGCEAERSSSGAVTLLSSTAEFRLNGKIVLRFNADRDQWEALDKRFQAVKTEGKCLTHFNQIIKHYLLQGCTDRLRCYLKYSDKHIRHRTSGVGPSDKPLPYTECPDEDIRNRTSGVDPSDKPLPYTECPYEDIRNRTSGVDPCDAHRQEEDKEEEKRIRVFSVLSCILIACIAVASVLVKKIRKCNIVRPPAEDAYRGYSREMENEDHAGGDPDQTETEDDGGGQNLGQVRLTRTAGLTTPGDEIITCSYTESTVIRTNTSTV